MSTVELLDEGLVPTPGKRVLRGGLHALTGIRFFAAIWVVTYHFGAAATARGHMPHPVTVFLEHGYLGVSLFFMLSGFILYYSYQGNLRTPRDLYKFFVARVARLYPVYLLAIVISIPLHRRMPGGLELLVFPMLQSWGPAVSGVGFYWIIQAWTLSVEAFFYCCFPFFLLMFRRDWSPVFLWLVFAGLFVLNVALHVPQLHPLASATWLTSHVILPVLCLPEFLLGMVLGVLFLRKPRRKPGPLSSDWITAAGILACCLAIAAGPRDTFVSIVAVGCFSWIIYRLAAGRGWLTDLLSSRMMMLLGGASYTIYLVQALLHQIVQEYFIRFVAVVFPIVLLSFSCLVFLFYEEPLREVIRNLLLPKSRNPKIEA